jgi:hypothetical protein
MHKETRSTSFLVEPQNQGRRVFRFGPQNRQLQFGDLGLKFTSTVSWFGPQNQAGDGLSVVPQNQQKENGMGHVLRSKGLLRLEASRARVFQFASKLVETRRRMVHIVSSQRSREDEAEDGWINAMDCIGLFYPNFVIFVVLGPWGILVFWMGV